MDTNGDLTLVECKLAANPQIRREIVGQMFDYASGLWKMDVDDFAAKWNHHNNELPFQLDTEEGQTLRHAVAQNLAEGKFRIVLAVDAINAPLKRMVEYLNAMSGPGTSIIAVEYSHLTQGSIQILMPQVYGRELAEAKAAPADDAQIVWTADLYRSWLRTNDPGSLGKFNLLTAAATSGGMTLTGSKTTKPSGGLRIYDRKGQWLGTVSFIYYSAQGTSLEFSFVRLSKMTKEAMPDGSLLEMFLQQLGAIPGLEEVAGNLRSSGFTSRKPNVPLSALSEDSLRKTAGALRILTT
ncbi:hypothetical protein [Arthrobacter sp. H14]|uniref:hypothetical protein n=1 Tax=Arthrobacter sp. H14 TaxID=1312959 RepID=UPI001C1DD019|nr:hypothetical protein [Arthrobacter sp. H14]